MEADKILKHKAAMLNIIFPLLVLINISPPFKLSDKLLMKQKLVSFSFSVQFKYIDYLYIVHLYNTTIYSLCKGFLSFFQLSLFQPVLPVSKRCISHFLFKCSNIVTDCAEPGHLRNLRNTQIFLIQKLQTP